MRTLLLLVKTKMDEFCGEVTHRAVKDKKHLRATVRLDARELKKLS